MLNSIGMTEPANRQESHNHIKYHDSFSFDRNFRNADPDNVLRENRPFFRGHLIKHHFIR